MTAVVSVRGLSKRYGDVHALDDVSFEVAEHTVCGLLGRNGAGKTTAMQLLTGHIVASAGAQALVYGVVLYLLLQVEQATGGWGLALNFFGIPFLVTGDPVSQVVVYAGPLLLTAFLGALLGIVHTRWQMRGLYLAMIVTLLGLGLAAFLLTWQQAWTSFAQWFADTSVLALLGGWVPLVGVVLAAATYGILRRTPV